MKAAAQNVWAIQNVLPIGHAYATNVPIHVLAHVALKPYAPLIITYQFALVQLVLLVTPLRSACQWLEWNRILAILLHAV